MLRRSVASLSFVQHRNLIVITRFRFILSCSIGANWVFSISVTVNPVVSAGVSWWEAAVLVGTVLGQFDIATNTVMPIVRAEVPALVTPAIVTPDDVNLGHILNITGDISPKLVV